MGIRVIFFTQNSDLFITEHCQEEREKETEFEREREGERKGGGGGRRRGGGGRGGERGGGGGREGERERSHLLIHLCFSRAGLFMTGTKFTSSPAFGLHRG